MAKFKRKYKNKNGEETEYWYVQVTDETGQKHTRSAGKVGEVNKSALKRLEDELRKEVKNEIAGKDNITYGEFLERFLKYKKHSVTEGSFKNIQRSLKRFGDDLGLHKKKLKHITDDHVNTYREMLLEEGVSKGTAWNHLVSVSSLFNAAIERQMYFKPNPVSLAKNPKPPFRRSRVCTPEEEKILLSSCGKKKWLRVAILLTLYCGMRQNEIRLLKNDDIDTENNMVISRAENIKRGRKDIVRKLPGFLKQEILELRMKNGGGEYVLWGDKEPPSKQTFSNHFMRLCRDQGIEGLRFHDLRHTLATRMSEAGYGIEIIKETLGHSTIHMAMQYTHPKKRVHEAIDEIAEKFHKENGGDKTKNPFG